MKIKLSLIPKLFVTFVVLASLFTVNAARSATPIANEFWISTNATANFYTSGAGGTIDNPLDGSSQANFDANMQSLPPYSTIHLMAGTYQTHGADAFPLKSGQKILGSGIDVTILQRVGTGDNTTVLESQGGVVMTNIEISDLTCDCNYTSGTYTYHGVALEGSGHAIRRVKVINEAFFDHSLPNLYESWGIIIDGGPNADGVGNIIEECEVSHYAGGGGISAITINDGSGIIRNNRVLLAPISQYFAFNGSDTHDVLIEGNYVDGASSAVYGDTGGATNLTVVHNTFKNCVQTIFFRDTIRKNLTFAFNNIEVMNASMYSQAGAFYFLDFGGESYTNILIFGNNISDTGTTGTPQVFFVQAANVTGLVIANNSVDSQLTNYLVSCSNLSEYNNNDLFGNYRPDLNIPTIGGTPIYPFGLSLIGSAGASPALTALGLPSNPAVVVTNGSTQPITINNNFTVSGNVGIGTTSPSQKLSVSGNATVSGSLSIGIAAPNGGLSVGTAGSSPAEFLSSDSIFSLIRFGNPDYSHLMYIGVRKDLGNDQFQFLNGSGTFLMGINAASGNVGIGTNAPLQRLTVVGNISASGTNFASQFVGGGNGLTGITSQQIGAAASTNALVWNSITITNSAATNWATLSVTSSNALLSIHGTTVAILQTNGVLNAYNGLSTTLSNKLAAVTLFSGNANFTWTNTLPENVVIYVNGVFLTASYNGSIICGGAGGPTPAWCTVLMQPGSVVQMAKSGTSIYSVFEHPF